MDYRDTFREVDDLIHRAWDCNRVHTVLIWLTLAAWLVFELSVFHYPWASMPLAAVLGSTWFSTRLIRQEARNSLVSARSLLDTLKLEIES